MNKGIPTGVTGASQGDLAQTPNREKLNQNASYLLCNKLTSEIERITDGKQPFLTELEANKSDPNSLATFGSLRVHYLPIAQQEGNPEPTAELVVSPVGVFIIERLFSEATGSPYDFSPKDKEGLRYTDHVRNGSNLKTTKIFDSMLSLPLGRAGDPIEDETDPTIRYRFKRLDISNESGFAELQTAVDQAIDTIDKEGEASGQTVKRNEVNRVLDYIKKNYVK